ncbi:hypothetical protein CGK93_05715 [Arthrobacter sp. YN]|nr:hypothetical protein CGK93_05715 [Arthrobacter sp. YN]
MMVLALVVGGLLLTFLYGAIIGRKAKALTARAAKAPGFRTTTATSTAEYQFSPALVWSVIRPAEAAIADGSDVAYAFTVPPIPDGPGERQCFFGRNGSVSMLEVLEEVPERLAVTQALFPPGDVSTKTVYRLEPTGMGCRLTLETIVETPDFMIANEAEMQRFGDSYLSSLESLLEKRSLEDARQ